MRCDLHLHAARHLAPFLPVPNLPHSRTSSHRCGSPTRVRYRMPLRSGTPPLTYCFPFSPCVHAQAHAHVANFASSKPAPLSTRPQLEFYRRAVELALVLVGVVFISGCVFYELEWVSAKGTGGRGGARRRPPRPAHLQPA